MPESIHNPAHTHTHTHTPTQTHTHALKQSSFPRHSFESPGSKCLETNEIDWIILPRARFRNTESTKLSIYNGNINAIYLSSRESPDLRVHDQHPPKPINKISPKPNSPFSYSSSSNWTKQNSNQSQRTKQFYKYLTYICYCRSRCHHHKRSQRITLATAISIQ